MPATILLLEENAAVRAAMEEHLTAAGHKVQSPAEFGVASWAKRLADCDLVVAGLDLPGCDAEELLARTRDVCGLIFTAVEERGSAMVPRVIELMRCGAADCLVKPITGVTLLRAVTRALKVSHLEAKVRRLEGEIERLAGTGAGIVGSSPAIRKVRDEIERVGAFATPVLVLGETGVGKELVARAVHKASGLKGEFVPVNAAAFGPELFEAELFGYEPGAFTGAKGRKTGLVELADGGTFFLDEIGELAAPVQAKLLRFLDDGSFRRLGGIRELTARTRIIAATNRALDTGATEFRSDLYYRLAAFTIKVPPLRERTEDIPELVAYFLAFFARRHGLKRASVTEAGLAELKRAPWPGNVRQLKHFVERLLLSAPGQETLDAAEVLALLPAAASALSVEDYRSGRQERMVGFDREFFAALMQRHNGNISAAAREVGLDRKTLAKKLKAAGLRAE